MELCIQIIKWLPPTITHLKISFFKTLGGDALKLFETRPLEDILADIAEGWNDTQRCIGKVRASVLTEVSYVL